MLKVHFYVHSKKNSTIKLLEFYSLNMGIWQISQVFYTKVLAMRIKDD